MPPAPRPNLSSFEMWLRVMGLGVALLFLMIAGTYFIPAGWDLVWLGIWACCSLIGGNVYAIHLRGGPTRRDWPQGALSLVLLIAGALVIVYGPDSP